MSGMTTRTNNQFSWLNFHQQASLCYWLQHHERNSNRQPKVHEQGAEPGQPESFCFSVSLVSLWFIWSTNHLKITTTPSAHLITITTLVLACAATYVKRKK